VSDDELHPRGEHHDGYDDPEESGGSSAGSPGSNLLPPPARSWVHPSELPSFLGTSTTTHAAPTPNRWVQAAVGVAALTLLSAGVFVWSTSSAKSPETLSALSVPGAPTQIQPVASSMVPLQITTGSVHTIGSGLVIEDGTIIATTAPLTAQSSVTAMDAHHVRSPATIVRSDAATGLTLLSLPRHLPTATTSAAVTTSSLASSLAAISVAVIERRGAAVIEWSRATIRSSDNPLVVDHVTLGTLTAPNPLDATAGSCLVASDGTMMGIAAPRLGPHAYLPASLVVALSRQLLEAPTLMHGILRIQGKTSPRGGVEVVTVDQLGPSAGALQPGDVITEVNTTSIRSTSDLVDTLYSIPAATQVTLAVTHGQRTRSVTLALVAST